MARWIELFIHFKIFSFAGKTLFLQWKSETAGNWNFVSFFSESPIGWKKNPKSHFSEFLRFENFEIYLNHRRFEKLRNELFCVYWRNSALKRSYLMLQLSSSQLRLAKIWQDSIWSVAGVTVQLIVCGMIGIHFCNTYYLN